MTDYHPPLDDIFVLDHLVDLDELCQLEAFSEHRSRHRSRGVIEEFGRLDRARRSLR
ncbi:MAG: acyl-CoA dehydrogenase N-terminal domain-containing protein [Acidimicrobiia bacterium]|nr:acyl-CoA dehydrogenase N-terminal domain-containing protein [Acidimicrobiia bacterium]